MQVQNGMGPGVRRSKRLLSVCHTRHECSMETSHKSVKGLVIIPLGTFSILLDKKGHDLV